jgi:RNA polymerase sigma-70 factor, ECF subfamily
VTDSLVHMGAPFSGSPAGMMTMGEDAPQASLAVGAIYEEHCLFVWRSLRRLGVSEAEVADAVQDVFLVVHRRLSDFEQRCAMKTWLFGIAMQIASEYVRRSPRRREERLADLAVEGSDPSPAEDAARSEAIELLYLLLQNLPAEQRAVFILAELEQMSIIEIASAVGASGHTIASRLKTARRRFEQGLQRHRTRDQWRIR